MWQSRHLSWQPTQPYSGIVWGVWTLDSRFNKHMHPSELGVYLIWESSGGHSQYRNPTKVCCRKLKHGLVALCPMPFQLDIFCPLLGWFIGEGHRNLELMILSKTFKQTQGTQIYAILIINIAKIIFFLRKKHNKEWNLAWNLFLATKILAKSKFKLSRYLSFPVILMSDKHAFTAVKKNLESF